VGSGKWQNVMAIVGVPQESGCCCVKKKEEEEEVGMVDKRLSVTAG